jgi:hypothetical protein
MRRLLPLALAVALVPAAGRAQDHAHTPGMTHPPGATPPAQAGQAAFAAIAEVVRVLQADPSTDWSRVDIERLRRHLVDMDAVTMRARVRQEPVPGGARFVVDGDAATAPSIVRMARAHAGMLARESGYQATVAEVPGGVRMTVLAAAATPRERERVTARIRGLGFVGLLTAGEHHGPHHLAIARGTTPAGHGH